MLYMQNNKNPKNIAVTIFLFGMLGIIFFTLWYTSTPHKDSKNKESVTDTQQEEIDALKIQVEVLKDKNTKTTPVQQSNSQDRDFELQAKCAEKVRTQEVQNQYGLDRNDTTYSVHFNSEMNKCLILINVTSTVIDGVMSLISDINSNKIYAVYTYRNYKDNGSITACKYSQKTTLDMDSCSTEDSIVFLNSKTGDWQNFIKPFMNN